MDILDFTGTRYIESATSRPTFSGTAASEVGKTGAQALISFGGQRYTVDVDINGKFTWTAPSDVADGSYSFSVIIRDRAGNNSAPALRTFIVDTTPPEAPTLLKLTDNVGDVQGSFDESKPTDDKTPTLTGIAQKGATVFLKDAAGSVIGSAVADKESGVWVITPVKELEDGVNNLTLIAQEVFAGQTRVSTESPLAITVAPDGSSGPGDVTITDALDDAGNYKGSLASGATTDDTTPTLRGTVTAGQDVTVQYRLAGSSEWMTGVPAISGTQWSWTAPDALAEGKWEFRALTDGSSTGLFVLDITSAPQNAVTITHALDNAGEFSGELANGTITDDVTPELRGRAESNSIVYLFYRTAGSSSWTALGSVQAATDGSWASEVDRVPTGNIEFRATASDDASASGDSFGLTIIASGSNVPVISGAWDDVGYNKGVIIGGYTDDTTPTLKGKAEANSKVIVEYSNGTETYSATVQVGKTGQWEFTPPDLELGKWSFRAKTGNEGNWSNEIALNIIQTEVYDFKEVLTHGYNLRLNSGESFTFDSGLKVNLIGETSALVIAVGMSLAANNNISLEFNEATAFSFTAQNSNGSTGTNLPVDMDVLIYNTDGFLIDSQKLTYQPRPAESSTFQYEADSGQRIGKVILAPKSQNINTIHIKEIEWNDVDAITTNNFNFARSHYYANYVYVGEGEIILTDRATVFTSAKKPFDYLATPDDAKNIMGDTSVYVPKSEDISIDFRGATEFSYNVYSESLQDITLTLNIYDTHENLIKTINYTANKNAGVVPLHTFLDDGTLIGKISITGNAAFYINNLTWKTAPDAERPVENVLYFDNIASLKSQYFERQGVKFESNGYFSESKKTSVQEMGISAKETYKITLEKDADLVSLNTREFNKGSYAIFYNHKGEEIGRYDSGDSSDTTKSRFIRFVAPEGEKIAYFTLYPVDNALVDDLRIRYTDEQPDYVKPFAVQDDSLHQLAQVEDLASVALFGSEDQTDTLQLTGKNQVLDLSAHQDRIESMEIIDLTGKGDNSLKIDLSSLLAYGEQDLFIQDGKTQLMVKGDAGDVVQLKDILPAGSDISEWQHQDGTATVAGVEYQVYSHGDDAELLIQQGVKTELI